MNHRPKSLKNIAIESDLKVRKQEIVFPSSPHLNIGSHIVSVLYCFSAFVLELDLPAHRPNGHLFPVLVSFENIQSKLHVFFWAA